MPGMIQLVEHDLNLPVPRLRLIQSLTFIYADAERIVK